MSRCATPAFASRLFGLAALVAAPALAQAPRDFPQTALRGELVVLQPPDVALNGRAARLAPGARIRDQSNLLLMSGAVVNQRLAVHYTTDLEGQLLEVWVLTPPERARVPWPTSPAQAQAWRFDRAAQTWTRP